MAIIDRYLFKETLISWLSVLVVLLLIFCSKHFVRYMSDAVAGELPAYMVFQLLSLFTLSYLVLIIPFAFYLAIIITLGRLYKENEITAMEACGIGIPRITKSLLLLSVGLAVLVGVLSLWVAPWAELKQYEIRDEARAKSEFSLLAPGKFHEIRGGKGVFYMEALSKDQSRMLNIFIQLDKDGKADVFSARSGYVKPIENSNDYFVVLENGYRFQEMPDGGFQLQQYVESGVRIYQNRQPFSTTKIIAQPTAALFGASSLESIAELQWRLSMPVSCIFLGLIGVLLSRTTPREGRFAKLFFALLVYIAYIYPLMASKAGVAQASIPPWLGLWWVHLAALIFVLFLLQRQFGAYWLKLQFKTLLHRRNDAHS